MRDLESPSVSTSPLANIPTPTPPVASVPYPIPPVNHAHTSEVGAASQNLTTPHISIPISSPNVSATTPYPRLFRTGPYRTPRYRIPSPTSSFSGESCQHPRRHHIRRTRFHPFTRPHRGFRHTLPTCSRNRDSLPLVENLSATVRSLLSRSAHKE